MNGNMSHSSEKPFLTWTNQKFAIIRDRAVQKTVIQHGVLCVLLTVLHPDMGKCVTFSGLCRSLTSIFGF